MTRLLALLLLLLPSVADAQMCIVSTECGAGTGCCIGRDANGNSLILTAAHCVSEGREYRVYDDYKSFQATVIVSTGAKAQFTEWKADVALLSANDGGYFKVQPLGHSVEAGESAGVNGFPGGEMRNIRRRTARILAINGDCMVLDQPSRGGESGGPILNKSGEIVGVLSSTSDRDTLCSNISCIRRVCGKWLDGKPTGKPPLKVKSNVVMYHFSAPWCGPCQLMEPICRRLKDSGMKMRDINTDTDPQTTKQMGISSIPAFVVVVDGKPVDRIARAATEGELRRLYEKYAVDRTNPDCAKPAPAPPPEESPPVPVPDPISTPQPPEGPPASPPPPDLSNIQGQLDALFVRIETIEKCKPQRGEQGPAGPPGPVGRSGKDGTNGNPGRDGKDGAFIASAQIRNGHLILIRSDGREIDAGALPTSNDSETSQRVAELEKQIDKPFDVQLFVNGKPVTDVKHVQPHGGWLSIDLPWEVVKPQEK